MGEYTPDEGEAPIIVGLTDAALHMYRTAIDSLPFPEDTKFQKRVDVVLTGLRKLEGTLTEAAGRNRKTPAVILSLSEVRRTYDDLMARAAAAPGSTLGQQLYTVRRRAGLSAEEVANGTGLRVDYIEAFETGEIPTEAEAAKINELIEALNLPGDNPGDAPYDAAAEEYQENDYEESHLNGWDESLITNNAEV